MKKYLALLLFALITTKSFGQSNYQDVVYLKNGSIIRGVIIEQVPNKSGYKGIVEWGYQIGTGGYGMDRLKLNMINGYQINPYFSLGLGTGLRYYFDSEAALIPIFADFRANFMDNNVSPYLSLGVGYSFDAANSFEGVGFHLNPTIGVSLKVSEKSAMNVGLGYEMQRMKFFFYETIPDWYHLVEITENSGAISINVGISF